jgi:type IV secretory pathway VirB10-like protein
MTKIAWTVLLILTVALSACSRPEPTSKNLSTPTGETSSIPLPSAEIQSEASPKTKEAKPETNTPPSKANGPAPRAPRDFPFEMIEGAELTSETLPNQEGKRTQKVVFKSQKTMEELARFYEATLRAKRLEIRKMNQQEGEEQQIWMLGQNENGLAGIVISKKPNDPHATVVLTWATIEEKQKDQ